MAEILQVRVVETYAVKERMKASHLSISRYWRMGYSGSPDARGVGGWLHQVSRAP
jgi:hypothetical protein